MALHLVTIWNCTITPGWQQLSMNERIDGLRSAVQKAHGKAAPYGSRSILVAPEYAFSAADANNAKPAEQATEAEVDGLIYACKMLTMNYRNLLLIPGTIAWRQPVTAAWHQARNTGLAFYQGQLLTRWDKLHPVGEVSAQDAIANPRLTFQAGAGYADFNNQNHSWGMEICADATNGGTLPHNVDVHIVMGQGVGLGAIQNRGTEYVIIADPGNFTVADRTGAARATQRLPAGKALYGGKLHYWTIDL